MEKRYSFPAIAGFRIIREIGRGGMGAVYEAAEKALDGRVTLEVLPASALSEPKQVQWFERERVGGKVSYVLPVSLTDWVEVLLLRCEAEALIVFDPAFPSNPFANPGGRDTK